jgi:hypothetical protein
MMTGPILLLIVLLLLLVILILILLILLLAFWTRLRQRAPAGCVRGVPVCSGAVSRAIISPQVGQRSWGTRDNARRITGASSGDSIVRSGSG